MKDIVGDCCWMGGGSGLYIYNIIMYLLFCPRILKYDVRYGGQ